MFAGCAATRPNVSPPPHLAHIQVEEADRQRDEWLHANCQFTRAATVMGDYNAAREQALTLGANDVEILYRRTPFDYDAALFRCPEPATPWTGVYGAWRLADSPAL
jgi:hypothetical protein